MQATPVVETIVWLLAVWRETHLLHAEDGPWDVFVHVRRVATRLGAGRALECFYCLSLWVALPVAAWLARDVAGAIGLWLGLSGGACLAQRATTTWAPAAPIWNESA